MKYPTTVILDYRFFVGEDDRGAAYHSGRTMLEAKNPGELFRWAVNNDWLDYSDMTAIVNVCRRNHTREYDAFVCANSACSDNTAVCDACRHQLDDYGKQYIVEAADEYTPYWFETPEALAEFYRREQAELEQEQKIQFENDATVQYIP